MEAFRRLDDRGDAAALNEPNGRIAFRFHARDVHLVMGPHDREHPIDFRVTVDGSRRARYTEPTPMRMGPGR